MTAADVIRRMAGEETGMTLVELLISLVVGVVVMLGAFALLEVTTKVVGRVTDQVGANQLGRQAIAYVEGELQSACIEAGGLQSDGTTFGPIQYGLTDPSSASLKLNSDASDLVFWSLSDATAATGTTYATTGATTTLHYLQYQSTTNTMTDTTWPVTGGTTPATFTYGAATTKTIGKINNLGTVSQNGTTPIFQYYQYTSPSYQLSTTPMSLPLTAATAANVAAVAINFQVTGSGGDSTTTQNNSQTAPYLVDDEVDFRLTPVQNASSTNVPYPCQ